VAARRSDQAVDTRTAILDVAERLVQARGFNAFSYADVAAELGITSAALHYHFAGKAELGESLITRYAENFMAALAEIDATGAPAATRLRDYCAIYRDALADQRMCLCGMLAAEYETLAGPMRDAVVRFFDDNERWLAQLLDAGRDEGSLAFTDAASAAATMVLATLEGAMLVARPYGGTSVFEAVVARLLLEFGAAA
jgi:TetR/AcrR family transcriptional repressor of nem operon